MRVIGGTAKGTKLHSVPGSTTRPILDRVKTSLFDILRPKIPEASFLDMFAGSGGVGIEALSLGAKNSVFLELSKKATDVIRKNLEKTDLTDHADVRNTDAFKYIRNTAKSFDLIFIAPPQYEGIWLEALQCVAERPELINEDGKIVVQIDPKEEEGIEFTSIQEVDRRKYGNTLLLFYNKASKI